MDRIVIGSDCVRRIGIIGAGLAGITAARTLSDAGFEVSVFEKSGGIGGRISTRRTEYAAFDHGAQYLTAKGAPFRALLTGLSRAGSAAYWEPSGKDRDLHWHVGVPGMSGLLKPMLFQIDVQLRRKIETVSLTSVGVKLTGDDGREDIFDRVVVTAPAPQAHALLDGLDPVFGTLADVIFAPCWAGMFAFQDRVDRLPDVFRGSDHQPVAWFQRMATRAGRAPAEAFVVHAGGAWSRDKLELPKEEIIALLSTALEAHAGGKLEPVHADAHRWRYARVDRALDVPFLKSADDRLFVAGDGMLGGRAEAAFESARLLCDHIKTL